MTVIVVVTFVLISIITIPQFKTQSDKYHSKRLERKEAQIQRSIAYFSKELRENRNVEESLDDMIVLISRLVCKNVEDLDYMIVPSILY